MNYLLPLPPANDIKDWGRHGFDSRMECCVSTQRVDGRSLKSMTFEQLTGENNYALAA